MVCVVTVGTVSRYPSPDKGVAHRRQLITARNSQPPSTALNRPPQAGLIDTEPTSELAVIVYGELADRRTVTVDAPTNVWVLIL